MTRFGVVVFVAAAALGPWYTVPGYSVASNVISQLAAQNTPNNFIMSAAFLLLGGAVVFDGLRAARKPLLPFVVFGLAFALAGLFGHRPIDAGVSYSALADQAHSVLASVSGVALTVGFAWQARLAVPGRERAVCIALAVACVALPLLMLAAPAWQGITQRVMYGLVFVWLFVRYPGRADG